MHEFKVTDKDKWDSLVENNKDDYGKCVVEYTAAWANEMENKINSGCKLEDIAKSTSHQVNTEGNFGITGFMYGCAVSILADCWIYGEQLRKWHNGELGQPNSEGTLNPACISMEV